MKGILVIWLLSAGIGISYSIVSERRKRIETIRNMEEDLKQFSYYMCEWILPVEEVLKEMIKRNGVFVEVYKNIYRAICEKRDTVFCDLWITESEKALRNMHVGKQIKTMWENIFLNMPMEPMALRQYLDFRNKQLSETRIGLEEKYRSEQKLVLSMGFFVSAFLCLILW